MPRTMTIEKTVWTFEELDDSAKEKAREWFRDGNLDYDWWDATYDDAATIADILGIQLRTKPVKLMNGATRYDPAIFFSGFASQGDGACFEGDYQYAKGATKKIREHAPKDLKLHRIADDLQKLQRENFYRLTATTKHRDHYYHSGCMSVDIDGNSARTQSWARCEEELTQLLRDFADWIYGQLEKESDYLQSDECVDESIKANGYEFTEQGSLA